MGKLNKQHLEKILQTRAGENALRVDENVVSQEIISAAKYYTGVPDGKYFNEKDFGKDVTEAKKAYITLNTVMGGETAEMDRFKEGKKQTSNLLTPLGVKKMINLFTHLYCFGSGNNTCVDFETVRACRQSEISEGESIVGPLTSTTKLSIDEIMVLGYGNKNGLAICRYKFHEGASIFDMEELGKEYLKPEEREVLLLMGNKLSAHCLGYDDRYLGKDGKPALIYEVDVYAPDFINITGDYETLENTVYNEQTIGEIKEFYEALNGEGEFPNVPECYKEWKEAFKKLVFLEIKKLA